MTQRFIWRRLDQPYVGLNYVVVEEKSGEAVAFFEDQQDAIDSAEYWTKLFEVNYNVERRGQYIDFSGEGPYRLDS